jgi:hypothetical protein
MSRARNEPEDQYSAEETARRRDDAIRRALGTRPKPQSEYVGKTKRAKARKRSRVKKAPQ